MSLSLSLVPVIEAAGGRAQAGTPVSEILLDDGKVVGVRTQSGETVKHLLPQNIRKQDWAREVATFKPSLCHFDLFLGFEGDISQHGAARLNHWFYER